MLDEFTDETTEEMVGEYNYGDEQTAVVTIEELAKERLEELETELRRKEDPLLIFPLEKSVPSEEAHLKRNDFQCCPTGKLRSNGGKIFYDANNKEWFRVPWYLNFFHNPAKNIKLIHFDYNDRSGAVGSSEIIINKSLIKKEALKGFVSIDSDKINKEDGSYNYRDMYVTSHWRHFLGDVLPYVIYCKGCGCCK